jgi:cytochrome P450
MIPDSWISMFKIQCELRDNGRLLAEFPEKVAQRCHSKIIKYILSHRPAVYICDPKFGKMIATSAKRILKKSKLLGRDAEELFGDNIFTSHDDQVWQRHRTLLNPAFLPNNLKYVAEITISLINEKYIPIIEASEDNKRDVSRDFGHIALDIIGKAGFGYEFNALTASTNPKASSNTLSEKAQNIFTYINYYQILPLKFLRKKLKIGPFGKFHDGIEAFRKTIHYLIKIREQFSDDNKLNVNNRDLLSLLVNASESLSQENVEKPLTHEEMVADCFFLLLAGHETSAKTLTFALYLLSQNYGIQSKAQKLLDEKLEGNCPTFEDYNNGNLQYIDMIVKETLRLYPAATAIIREAYSDLVYDEYLIPKNTLVIYSWYGFGRNEEYWEEADKFVPERFDGSKKIDPFIYCPFGIGNRRCIGQKFAEIEIVLILSILLQRYNIKLADSQYKMVTEVIVTQRPKKDIEIIFEKRSDLNHKVKK